MNKPLSALFALALMAGSVLVAQAQQARVSPHETITANIDGNDIKLVYGRPYSKDPKSGEIRKIWGTLVPWGKAWRAGADEATTLTIAMPIVAGETTIPAGSYTLYLVPQETGASKLAFSTRTGQWGIPVDESKDLTRIDVKKDSFEKRVDQWTMAIDKNPSGGGIIKMTWENVQYSLAFTVKK